MTAIYDRCRYDKEKRAALERRAKELDRTVKQGHAPVLSLVRTGRA